MIGRLLAQHSSVLPHFRSSPVLAEQSISAADNGTVACVALAEDLVRISLACDLFASVSKMQHR